MYVKQSDTGIKKKRGKTHMWIQLKSTFQQGLIQGKRHQTRKWPYHDEGTIHWDATVLISVYQIT